MIQYINIMTTDGKSLLFRNYGDSEIDRDLLAGFLSAFSGFMKEISHSDIKSTATEDFKYYYTVINSLMIVICSDFFAAVTTANHGASLIGDLLLLFLDFQIKKTCFQYLHGFRFILMLRLFILAGRGYTRRYVNNSYCRICGVNVLSAMSGCPKYVDAQIIRIYLYFNTLSFRQNNYRCCGGVNASLSFRFRYPLHSMHPTFELQVAVNSFTGY